MRFRPAAMVGVLLGLALVLLACGSEGTAAGGGATTAGNRPAAAGEQSATTSSVDAKSPPAPRRCSRLLGGFLDSIESLNNALAIGLDYESYLRAVNHVRATYAELPGDRLPLPCLALAGIAAERALNIYIDAANAWGNCLASSSCNPESVEPKLQRRWEEASDLLSEARSGLRGLG